MKYTVKQPANAEEIKNALHLDYSGKRRIPGDMIVKDEKRGRCMIEIPVKNFDGHPIVLTISYCKDSMISRYDEYRYFINTNYLFEQLEEKYGWKFKALLKRMNLGVFYYSTSRILNKMVNIFVERYCHLLDKLEGDLNELIIKDEDEFNKLLKAIKTNDMFDLMAKKRKTTSSLYDKYNSYKYIEKREALRMWFMDEGNFKLVQLHEDGTNSPVKSVYDIINYEGFIGMKI